MHKPLKKTTAVGLDCVKPTDYQVQSGLIVIPKRFYDMNQDGLRWKKGFTAIAFGETLENRKIDYDRRLNLRLRDKIEPGDVLRLAVIDERLVIDKA